MPIFPYFSSSIACVLIFVQENYTPYIKEWREYVLCMGSYTPEK
jgi:hypothetical protein